MPDFQRRESEGEPSMAAIRRTDGFIDALAVGRPVPAQDAADAELAALLGNWRDEMRWPPATGLITEADALAALNAGKAQKRLGPGRDRWTVDTEITPRRNRRGMSMVGAAAAAVLCIGGFGAVVAGAGPGDGLYGLRTMLFGTPKEVRDDQVGLAAKTTLNQVQNLIEQGDWNQAQNKLVEVSTQVASIGDEQQKQDLLDQFNDLSAKVVERDPAATAPPGVVYTVPPSAAELVPAVAPPTSTPSAPPPPSDSTTPATSTTSGSPTSGTSSASSSPSSPSSSPSSSSSSSSSSSASSSASPSASPSSPSPSAATETTPPAASSVSQAASTTPPPAATSTPPASENSSPAPRSAQTTTPTSAAPVATTVPEPSPAATTATPAPAPAETATTATPAPTPAQTAAVTTSALVPVPAG